MYKLLITLLFLSFINPAYTFVGQIPSKTTAAIQQSVQTVARQAVTSNRQTQFQTAAQQALQHVASKQPLKPISWREFKKINNNDSQQLLQTYQENNTQAAKTAPGKKPIQVKFINSTPNYKKILSSFTTIYIGENAHESAEVTQEVINLLRQLRAIHPQARILLASEFLVWNGEKDVSLLKIAKRPSSLKPLYPSISRAADELEFDQLALDDFILESHQLPNHDLSFSCKVGSYLVNTIIPETKWRNDPNVLTKIYYMLTISTTGTLERNRQWARYINAVAPFYDIVVIHSGSGHMDQNDFIDLPTKVNRSNYLGILISPPDEKSDPTKQKYEELFSQANENGLIANDRQARTETKKEFNKTP